MLNQYPELDDYENLWPLEHILISLLKYSACRAKGLSAKRSMAALQKTVLPSVKSTNSHLLHKF